MTAFFQTFISFAALCTLCVYAARQLRLHSALAPLAVASASLLYFSLFGMLHLLAVGAWLYFFCALAALVHMILTRKKGGFLPLRTPGFCLWVVAGLCLMALLAARQPLMLEWDEYSFWGTAARLTSENNVLWTQAEIGWPWPATQRPGLIVFSYLFNFFGSFATWRMYFAYDILLLAVWAVLIAAVPWKKWYLAVPGAVIGFILPYMEKFQREISFSNQYLSALADYPMGILFGGAIAYYYHCRKTDTQNGTLGAALVLCAVAMVKDTGLPLALVGAVVICTDLWLCEKNFTLLRLNGKAAKGTATAVLLASPLVSYQAWTVYLTTALKTDQSSVGGVSNFTPVQMVVEGVRMLFGFTPSAAGAPFTEKFATVKNEMLTAFVQRPVTMVGTGLRTVLFILVILAGIMLLTKDKTHRRRTALYTVLSTLGFMGWYLFIGLCYVFVFKEGESNGLSSYGRYIGTYYIAWLCGAVALLVLGALCQSRWKNLLSAALVVLCLGFMWRFDTFIQRELCIIEFPDVTYGEQNRDKQKADAVLSALPQGSRIFFAGNDVTGGDWFIYSYALLPDILEYSWGSGACLAPEQLQPDERYACVSAAQLAAEIYAVDAQYLLLHEVNERYITGYESLFADGGAAYLAGETYLYQVQVTGTPEIVMQAPENGEFVQNSDSTAPAEGIRVMQNYTQHFVLVPVAMEVAQ